MRPVAYMPKQPSERPLGSVSRPWLQKDVERQFADLAKHGDP